MKELTKARAALEKVGNGTYYQIYFGNDPSSLASLWRGPYRDKTDAENAAMDEAKRNDLDLSWVYSSGGDS